MQIRCLLSSVLSSVSMPIIKDARMSSAEALLVSVMLTVYTID